jgi:NADH-quinone oxidoreductase subunit N
MFGFFSISLEIFLILQVLFLLILGVILNEKIILLKIKYNVINFIIFFILFMTFLCIILSLNYNKSKKIKTYEYILLLILSIIGIFSMISSYDIITMYLSIELQSLCFYIVTCIKFYSNFSVEAGLKYFILGALSSGFLLFGASLIYGFTGMTNFLDLTILLYYYNIINFNYYYYKVILLGIIFLYCGLLFKIGIVPFHLWITDVYEGAPIHITLFFAVIPQFSIITLLIRLNMIFLNAYLFYIQIFFMILGALSVTVGTFGAIYQTKLKRIFAYSSISNMGYLISIMCSLNIESVFAVIFYLMVYNFISLSLWSFLLILKNKSTNTTFKDIREFLLLYNSNKFLSRELQIVNGCNHDCAF